MYQLGSYPNSNIIFEENNVLKLNQETCLLVPDPYGRQWKEYYSWHIITYFGQIQSQHGALERGV